MKKCFVCLLMTVFALTVAACSEKNDVVPSDDPTERPETPPSDGSGDDDDKTDTPDKPDQPDQPAVGGRVLVAYFSWSGTTERVARSIAELTGGELFRIEPVVPYPEEYTPCTEVALEERDSDARPAIAGRVADMGEYGTVFIGCPVWWHTAPMIISTFAESYDFAGKTVVPFCTYAATYRDETLAKIVALTPASRHLEGFGSTGSTSGVENWLKRIGVIE